MEKNEWTINRCTNKSTDKQQTKSLMKGKNSAKCYLKPNSEYVDYSLLVIYFATTHCLLRQNHITLSLMASSVKCFDEVSQVRTRGGHSWKCGTKWKLGTLLGGPSSLRETKPRKKKTTLPELSWHPGTSPFSFSNYSFVLYIFEIFCVFVNKVLQGFTTLPDVGVMHLSRNISIS
jgi:hypothetical protein